MSAATMTGMAGVFAALLEQSIGVAPEVEGAVIEEAKAKGGTPEDAPAEVAGGEKAESEKTVDSKLVQCLVAASVMPVVTDVPERKTGATENDEKGEGVDLSAAIAGAEPVAAKQGVALEPAEVRPEVKKDDGEATKGVEESKAETLVRLELDPVMKQTAGEEAPKQASAGAERRGEKPVATSEAEQVKSVEVQMTAGSAVVARSEKDLKAEGVVRASPTTTKKVNTAEGESVGTVTTKQVISSEGAKTMVTAVHAVSEEVAPLLKEPPQTVEMEPAGSTARTDAVTSAVPRTAVNTERLVEHLAGPEMKFTVRTSDSGQVQVSTNMHEKTMQVGVVTDRAETVTALRSEVPYLEGQMRRHAMELGEVKVSFQNAMSMNAGLAGEQRSRQEWRGTAPGFAADPETVKRVREEDAVMQGSGRGSGQLSLLA